MDVCCGFFFYRSGDHRDLHVLTHAFPTRRSSDLLAAVAQGGYLSAERHWPIPGSAGALRRRLGTRRSQAAVFDCQGSRPARLCRSEEHTSELQSLMRISYAVFCWKTKITNITHIHLHGT